MARPDLKKLNTKELLTQLPRALRLVWEADRFNAVILSALTVVQAAIPTTIT
jgi:hypothetical protein